MTTMDELKEADRQHEAAIAELREQMRDRVEAIERHEQRLERLDSCMEEMRATLATREDIRDLRADLRDRFDHYRVRIDAVEDEQEGRKSDRSIRQFSLQNWLMIAFFVIEVGVAIAQYQWMRSHA